MIKLLLADDNPLVRNGIKQLLAETPDMVVAGEVGDGGQVLDAARSRDLDVILLDISMPGMGGIEALRKVKRERPEIPVLVVSMHPEVQYASRTLRAGASGYVSKENVQRQLVPAIREVLKG
jgi:DNA-binding NarL/FixJ family response regulator